AWAVRRFRRRTGLRRCSSHGSGRATPTRRFPAHPSRCQGPPRVPCPFWIQSTIWATYGRARAPRNRRSVGLLLPIPSSKPLTPIQHTNGFRAFICDGFPDYVSVDPSIDRTAALGTVVGFAASKPIVSPNNHFELSLEKVGCFANTQSGTGAGLYDFYGEGK